MEQFTQKLEKYAELAVKAGINLQKGQTLVIMAPIAAADFVRLVTKKAYATGAKNVFVDWSDEEITLSKFLHAPQESFTEYPLWKAQGYEEMAAEGAGFLSVAATNPDLLKEVDPERIAMANKTAAKAMKGFRQYTQSGKVSWAVVSVPTLEWAAKVFPGLASEDAVSKLWDLIFSVTRVNQQDPVEAWKSHIDHLNEKLNYLNGKKFKRLFFRSSGTNLSLDLHEEHLWIGGGLRNEQGIYFIPNMPTEEVFTMPIKDSLQGKVTSTKPLNYGGKLIENFTLTFEGGKIVDFTAEKGYETLKKLIETDKGSHYIGEVALVPHHSPVSDSNVIFFNTLFDENASVHLAIGNAYPLCIEAGGTLSQEELEKKGANTSLTHVDFMIGSSEMEIDAETRDGRIVPIFREGNWALDPKA